MPNEQTIGESEEITDGMPNILAEQAAAAATTKSEGATEMKEETPIEKSVEKPEDKGEYKPKHEVTPHDEENENLALRFKEQQGKVIEQQKAKTPAATKPQPRVLDDLDEPLRPAFERMSNEAFNTLKPIVLEAKQNKAKVAELTTALEAAKKGQLPDSYYEHPMAYVLTPEFADASATVDTAQAVNNHWAQQVSDVRNGSETYIPLVRDAQGNIVTGQPQKVDKNTLTALEGVRNEAQTYYLNQKARLDGLASSHTERVNNGKVWVNDLIAKGFPNFAKDEVLKGMVADTIKTMPAVYQSNPLATLVGHLMVTTAQLGNALKAELAKAAKPAAAKPQPSAAAIAGGGAGGGASQLNDDDNLADAFARAKKGLL